MAVWPTGWINAAAHAMAGHESADWDASDVKEYYRDLARAAVLGLETAGAFDGVAAREAKATAVLRDALRPVSVSRHPRGPGRVRLFETLVDAVAVGWSPDALRDALSGNLGTAGDVGAVLQHRLDNLGNPPAEPATTGGGRGRAEQPRGPVT